MANRKTGLITGSNAKVKFAGKTLAYATDVQYSVDVAVIPVEVMGRFEVITNEPIAISVSGSFSVVRYTAQGNQRGLPDSAANGNGVGRIGVGKTVASDGDMSSAFNPSSIMSSSTVDLEIYERTAAAATEKEGSSPLLKIQDCRLTRMSGSLNKRGILTENYSFVGILYGDDSFTVGGTSSGADLA